MPRLPRLDLPDVPQHIVQRGHNRAACFYDDADRRLYLNLLRDTAPASHVSVHAYVLMSNHVHLLATPALPGAVSAMMEALGRQYVQRFNKRHERKGTLFDGRFKSSLVESECYLLCCYRYIELNPVRAGMAVDPGHYSWSSYRCNALGHADTVVTPHDLFLALGEAPHERRECYRSFVEQGISPDEYETIRSHLNQGAALGSAAFQSGVERASGRRAAAKRPGRPRKKRDPV